MKHVSASTLWIAVLISVAVGGVIGFSLGIASTKIGRAFLEDLFESEQKADTGRPKELSRPGFELCYPSNWAIDTEDEDYDPDCNFSIDSPGSAYTMFILGSLETSPEDNIAYQVEAFRKIMTKPTQSRFGRYGRYNGEGVMLKGRLLGFPTTVKLFSFCQRGQTAIIVQQCPDADLRFVQSGFGLIEDSFVLKTEPATTQHTQ